MTLEHAYYIGELVAAGALVISLIYVGRQVSLSTKATQSATAQSYVDTMNGYVGLINSSSNLAIILNRGAAGLENLKDEEVIQFSAFHDQCFITFEAFFFEWRLGMLLPELWDTYRHAIVALLVQPGQQQWWKMRHDWFHEGFQEYVETLVQKESSIPMHFRSVGVPTDHLHQGQT